MPPRTGPLAFRYGGICGAILAAIGVGNAIIQNLRHSMGPSANGLVIFSCVWFLATIGLLFVVGMLAARENGRLAAGAWAGFIAGAIPSAVLSIYLDISAAQQTLSDPRYTGSAAAIGVMIGVGIVFLLFAGIGGGIGAALGVLGALVGRSRYREAHPGAYNAGYPPYAAYPGMPPSPYPPYPPYAGYPPAAAYPTSDTYGQGYGQPPAYPPPLPYPPYPPYPPAPPYVNYPPAQSDTDWRSSPTSHERE